jgi:hypothetical protein
MNVTSALSTLAAPLAAFAAPEAAGALALPGTAARDAAMPDLAETTASTNSLQTIAALLAGQSPSLGASASESSITPPALPSAVDHGSHDEQALPLDLGGADDAAADPSQASISA